MLICLRRGSKTAEIVDTEDDVVEVVPLRGLAKYDIVGLDGRDCYKYLSDNGDIFGVYTVERSGLFRYEVGLEVFLRSDDSLVSAFTWECKEYHDFNIDGNKISSDDFGVVMCFDSNGKLTDYLEDDKFSIE